MQDDETCHSNNIQISLTKSKRKIGWLCSDLLTLLSWKNVSRKDPIILWNRPGISTCRVCASYV